MQYFPLKILNIIAGGFSCHNSVWRYAVDDNSREAVLKWAESCQLAFMHSSKHPPSAILEDGNMATTDTC